MSLPSLLRRAWPWLFLTSVAAASPLELFVSPRGDDANPGRPGAPFATIARARDEIRALKARNALGAEGAIVSILPGRYVLSQTLDFTAADSGAEGAPIVYKAAGPEPVRLLGGRGLALADFSPVSDAALRQRLDPAARDHVLALPFAKFALRHAGPFPAVFSDSGGRLELFWNGRRLPLARWPNAGTTTMKRVLTVGDARTGGTFAYRDDRPARWVHNPFVWLKGQWRVGWEDPAIRVARIDPAQHTITFAAGLPNGLGSKYHRPAGSGLEPWAAINLAEEIDEPGEWALDFATQTLLLWPPAGEGELMVSQLAEPMIALDGAAHLAFIGLTLEASLGDGLVLRQAESDLIAGCTVRNLARRGIVLDGYRSGIQSCDISEVGEGCIQISGGDKPRLIPSQNFVVNNHLHHYGVLKAQYSAAVDVGFGGQPNGAGFATAVGIRVANNLVHDAPRDAILVSGQDLLFEYNEILRCGFGTADTGAFYSWLDWTIRGVVIRYNYIHDTVGGVNPDDGASGSLVYGNIFSGPRTGVWIASGPDHIIRNNIFIKDEGPVFAIDDRGVARGYATNPRLHQGVLAIHPAAPPWSTRFPEMPTLLAHHPELPQRTRFVGNVVVMQHGDFLANKLTGGREKDPQLLVARDNFVTATDPGFVDFAGGNLALKPDAAVFRQIKDFPPIPFERIGLFLDQYRTRLPTPAEKGSTAGDPAGASTDRNFGT